MSKENKPIKKISYGQVTGSIFVNDDKESGNKWFSITIQKYFNAGTKKKPEWDYTNSYNKVDLPYLRIVSEECFRYTSENNPNSEEE